MCIPPWTCDGDEKSAVVLRHQRFGKRYRRTYDDYRRRGELRLGAALSYVAKCAGDGSLVKKGASFDRAGWRRRVMPVRNQLGGNVVQTSDGHVEYERLPHRQLCQIDRVNGVAACGDRGVAGHESDTR